MTGPSVSMAQQKKRPGLLRRLFGPRDQPPKNAIPRRSSSPNASAATKRRARQTTGYRTLCVRTCDGYYFPISQSVSRSRFKIDETVCKAMYGGASAQLFVLANGRGAERALSLTGRPLASQPYAFAYRSKFSEKCQGELKSGLAHLEKVFIARIAAKADRPPADGTQKHHTLPVPLARINPSEDPETLSNLAGRLAVARATVTESDEITISSTRIRRLGPDYYYIAPATINSLYDPPDLGPEFSLISSAHAADRADKDTARPGPTVVRDLYTCVTR